MRPVTGDRGASDRVCPDCAEEVLAAAKKCKHCGHEFLSRGQQRAKTAAAVALAIVIGLVLASYLFNQTNKEAEREADKKIDCILSNRSNC